MRSAKAILVWGLALLCLALAPGAAFAREVISTGDRYSPLTTGAEDYRLGVGEKVKITVFDEPSLSGEFAINADGLLSLPLIGGIPAIGKTPAEISGIVRSKLADGYLRDPKVSAEITTYRSFFVLGEVKMPGTFAYSIGMTALNAIALAQGFTPRAQKSIVFIRMAGSSNEEAYRLTPDLRVRPGDTIRLGEKYF